MQTSRRPSYLRQASALSAAPRCIDTLVPALLPQPGTQLARAAGLFLAIWALWYGRRKYRQVLEDIRKRNGERVEAADPQDCTIAAAVEEPGAVRALEESSVSAWTSAVKEGQAYGGGGGEHGEGKLGAVEDDMAELESSALGDARGAAPRD